MRRRKRLYAVESVFFARRIARFGQPVGVNQQRIAGLDREAIDREDRVGEHAERDSRGALRFRVEAAQMQERQVSGADQFDRAVSRRAANDERGELPG